MINVRRIHCFSRMDTKLTVQEKDIIKFLSSRRIVCTNQMLPYTLEVVKCLFYNVLNLIVNFAKIRPVRHRCRQFAHRFDTF